MAGRALTVRGNLPFRARLNIQAGAAFSVRVSLFIARSWRPMGEVTLMDALLLLVLGTALVIATAWSRREGLFPRCSLGCGHEAEKPVREERILLLAYGLT